MGLSLLFFEEEHNSSPGLAEAVRLEKMCSRADVSIGVIRDNCAQMHMNLLSAEVRRGEQARDYLTANRVEFREAALCSLRGRNTSKSPGPGNTRVLMAANFSQMRLPLGCVCAAVKFFLKDARLTELSC